jgi:hypothetical protein
LTVKDAQARVVKAQAALDDAKMEVEHSLNTLDESLAALGWHRHGAIASGRLYQRLGGSPVALDEVLAHELRAAA